MPNWCMTSIKFYSNNQVQLREMHEKFTQIYNGQPTRENGFGHGWMGDFANIYFPDIGSDNINCRGSVECIESISKSKNGLMYFTIHTQTAWGPKIGIWREIINKYYPDVCIAYLTEEPGMEIFSKWDETGGEMFSDFAYVDAYFPQKDGDYDYIDESYFASMEDLIKFLDKVLPFEIKPTKNLDVLSKRVSELLSDYEKKHHPDSEEETYFTAYLFGDVPPEDYDF